MLRLSEHCTSGPIQSIQDPSLPEGRRLRVRAWALPAAEARGGGGVLGLDVVPLLPVCWACKQQELLPHRRLMSFTARVGTPLRGPERHPRLAERMLARRRQAHTGLQPQKKRQFPHEPEPPRGPAMTWAPGGPWKSQDSCESRVCGEGLRAPGAGTVAPASRGQPQDQCGGVLALPGWYPGHHPAPTTDSSAVNWGQRGAGLVGTAQSGKEEVPVKCLLPK